MWEINLLMSIPSSQTFSRQSIYQLFKKKNEDLSYNSVSWIIEKGLKSNILFKVGSDSYSRREDTRKVYKPIYSSFATKVNKTIENSEYNEYLLYGVTGSRENRSIYAVNTISIK